MASELDAAPVLQSAVEATAVVQPTGKLGSEAPNIPGDKSISHRAVIFSALAEGDSLVTNVAPGEDVASSMRCVAQLGAIVQRDGLTVKIRGGAWRVPAEPLDCGNSGTTMRLLNGRTRRPRNRGDARRRRVVTPPPNEAHRRTVA